MAVSLNEMIARQAPTERRKIEARSKELIAEEMTLRALRKAAGKTQIAIAAKLGVKQESVSRIEKRADLLLSTLSQYVRALGGSLRLTAEFADGPVITLSGFSEVQRVDAVRPKTTVVRKTAAHSGAVRGRKPRSILQHKIKQAEHEHA